MIGDTSQNLANLISNILRLSKLENQQIFPALAAFDLSEQLCACLLAFEDAWEEKALDIETAIEDGVQACGDAELLSLVRRVVDIHGREIAVSSAPSRGSTFTVRIQQRGAWT